MGRGLQDQQAEDRAPTPASRWSLTFTGLQVRGRNLAEQGPESRRQVGARQAGQSGTRVLRASPVVTQVVWAAGVWGSRGGATACCSLTLP